jgi:ribosomal protein S18 acetylase RimI-like enzyme
MIKFKKNKSSLKNISSHLEHCSESFIPPLKNYVNIHNYSKKIIENSITFEAWNNDLLIGLIAVYRNNKSKKAFITNVSVFKKFNNNGIANKLLNNCVSYFKEKNYNTIELEVSKNNIKAVNFYKKNSFLINQQKNKSFHMSLEIKRDYNKEFKDTKDHKYAYNFDFDVMHPYMLKSFKPFFKTGNLLELGSFKGDFTKRFIPYFDDITCVEASEEAILEAKKSLNSSEIKYVNALFEEVQLTNKYDNVVLTHVLEHLDDPVSVLKRINDEWLSDTGRFFLVCPNANAPSRQIAVKMGLISHNSAITPAEKKHGHRITYSLDTLERDAKKAGLNVVHRSGIFFKALANFQWDKIIGTDVISDEYLEGCFQLGHQYPDLCSSIFLMCEKGE